MKDLRITTRNFTNNSNGSRIEKEIEDFRTQFSKTQGPNDTAWNSSVLRVLFKNESFARKYRIKIENFLKELLDEGEEFIVYHPPHPNNEQEFEDNHQTFHIDKVNRGNPDNSKILQKVPVYASNYEETLNCDEEEIVEDTKEENRPSMFTCFNCLGNHHMKECPEKIDWPRINANKKEILSGSNVRYHTDDQNNGLRAGIISESLRNALGLKRNQLPQFIYHMRVIGYPPGWMNEAVFETSGLSLYNSEGKAVSDENILPPTAEGTLYDGTKFIEFPGFNSPVPDGFLDEWKTLSMPPLQSHQQLKEALKSPNIITRNNLNKRKQIPNNEDVDSKKLKNVAEKPSTPLQNGCTTPGRHAKNFDFITPDRKQTNKRQSMSLSMSPGTPVLKQGNPYSKLPDADKFAEGITEHLPFENLPDAVGTFEKMRGVISGVQRKLNDIKS